MNLLHLYYRTGPKTEQHFNVQTSRPLTGDEMARLFWLIKQPESSYRPELKASLNGNVVEIGPLMHFETTFSTKAVQICHEAGLKSISRVEAFTRHLLSSGKQHKLFVASHCDRMTEGVYDAKKPLKTFETGILPTPTQIVALIEGGIVALKTVDEKMGLGFNLSKLNFIYDYFVNVEKRNPTDVELFMAAQALSEHCRHGFFGAKLYIKDLDEKELLMAETLFELVKAAHAANPGNSKKAFRDNACSIQGYEVSVLEPEFPFKTSRFVERRHLIHINNTAETHNYPTGISAHAGALTGEIGKQRDELGEGKGSLPLFSCGGYGVAGLHIPGYKIPGELNLPLSARLETPLNILTKGSNGVVDGANKYGQPLAGGCCRSVDLLLPDGERRAYLKPILYAGGVGTIRDANLEKAEPEVGMKIVMIGGPARRVGKGGGGRSSVLSTTEAELLLDFDGVQRGDPEMQNGVYRVNRACIEMGKENPIAVVHDQGAGGVGNVLLEIGKLLGGRVKIRKIQIGDMTMSVLEIVSCEYQERMAYLIYPERFEVFRQICQREEVNCEDLGEITGDGRIVFVDENDGTTPVDLDLKKFMEELPQEEYHLERIDHGLLPLVIPQELTVEKAFEMVCQQLSVCSKGFLVHKGDQSVGGLVAQQQCCGPMQIPVSDVAVSAISYLEDCGAAQALGETPLVMLVNTEAGARMTIAEALLNLCSASISGIEDVAYRANWMAAAKLPGEGAVICDAVVSMRDLSIKFKIKQDGGKDSLTMAELIAKVFVKAPVTLVLSAYVTVPDVKKVATPDIKRPGESILILLDPSCGKFRLGGSALAQALGGQLGNECPDIDNPELFLQMLFAILELHRENLLLAYHDRIGDGGLIITLAEMAMASNCGLDISLAQLEDCSPIKRLFSQEAGVVIECDFEREQEVFSLLESFGVPFEIIGSTKKEPEITINYEKKEVFRMATGKARQLWERTSFEIEKIQMPNSECALQEYALYENMRTPECRLTFVPTRTVPEIMIGGADPVVAIIRSHGTNSDREMLAAYRLAGFAVQEVNMFDLKTGAVTLDGFQGIAFPGGFADADVFGSAKGWAASILFDERLREMFEKFRSAPNKFSFSECNGCQLAMLMGWILGDVFATDLHPRMAHNISGRFEHRWPTVEVQRSPAIMFEGMEDTRLVVPSANGEGRFWFPEERVINYILQNNLAPLRYVDPLGNPTEQYPYNPSGSPCGIAALCSVDGRHLAMMPHPTRAFLMNQCLSWMPQNWKENLTASPWLKMFQNARKFC